MKLKSCTGKEVEIRGEPWYFDRGFVYFPGTQVFLTGDYAIYYDHHIDDIDCDGDMAYDRAGYVAYDMTDPIELFNCLRAVWNSAEMIGDKEAKLAIRKAIGIH